MQLSLKTPCRPCPTCGEGGGVEILRHQKFCLPSGHPLPSAFDVVHCPTCGFCYADTPASQADYDAYYARFSKYEDNQTSTGGGETELDRTRLEELARQIAAVVPDRTARIMDVGCANGGLLKTLHTLGYRNLLGIDPSPACVRNTGSHPGVRAVTGAVSSLPANLGEFDLIVLSHVLEHIADLHAVIAPLVSLLGDKGRLYVETPDASRYARCLVAPFQDFNVEHINHFDLGALQQLLARHGLTLEAGGQKTLEPSPGCPYPAVFGFFQRSASKVVPSPAPDFALREQLLDYIGRSQAQLDEIERKLAPLAASDADPVIVWGAGQFALRLLAETSLGRAQIAAFIDGNPIHHGKFLRGVPVLAPERLKDLPPHSIVIATLLHHDEIASRIRHDLRLTNPVLTF